MILWNWFKPSQNASVFSETVKYFRNGLKNLVFPIILGKLQDRDAVAWFWSSPHPMFGGFRLVPYGTVANLINQLDDNLYNTLPEQPEGPPLKNSPKKQPKDKSSSTPSGSKDKSSSTSSGSSKPTAQTTLTDQPPENNPLEEPNIWATILKLEGRSHENKVAEGFQNWLRKNLDASLFEVQKCLFITYVYTRNCTLKEIYETNLNHSL